MGGPDGDITQPEGRGLASADLATKYPQERLGYPAITAVAVTPLSLQDQCKSVDNAVPPAPLETKDELYAGQQCGTLIKATAGTCGRGEIGRHAGFGFLDLPPDPIKS